MRNGLSFAGRAAVTIVLSTLCGQAYSCEAVVRKDAPAPCTPRHLRSGSAAVSKGHASEPTGREGISYQIRGRAEARIVVVNGVARRDYSYIPYYGRSYKIQYRGAAQEGFTMDPPVSGLTAASLVTGSNDAYLMSRCLPPSSIRYVTSFKAVVDRQEFYCRD